MIDTGFGPNGCLPHVIDAGAFLGATHLPGLGGDVDSHGTHVCGTIGARPVNPATQRSGIAPGATLFSARVFPGPDTFANQGDIVLAIDALSRIRRVDLINMSLGASQPSEIEHDAIVDALQRGTLCICAAGNTGGGMEWPGRFPETVGVTALGFKDAPAPKGTLSANRVPTNPAMHGNAGLFLANFSSFGSDADVTGPGVGIIATVPERFGLQQPYASMDGTSMASPAVCGALAALLAVSPTYPALDRLRARGRSAGHPQAALQDGRSGGGVPGKRHSTRAIMTRHDMPDEERFVLAPKRSRRDVLRADWLDVVRAIPGVTIVGDANSVALQVSASAEGLARLQELFADVLNIERIIPHERS